MAAENAGRVLVVDDEEMIRKLISTHLTEAGYACQTSSDGSVALELLGSSSFDVLIADVRMPGLDGISLMRELQKVDPTLPVILIAGESSVDLLTQALHLGAYDFVPKPFRLHELDAAIERALERRRLQAENVDYQRRLEEKVREKTAGLQRVSVALQKQAREMHTTIALLRDALDGTIGALSQVVDRRAGQSDGRTKRIRAYAALITRQLGLPSEQRDDVSLGALLGDLGTLCIPESALEPGGEVSTADLRLLRQIPVAGFEMLGGIAFLAGASQVLLSQHEHWDGSGYPHGIHEEEIPLGARCVAIARRFEHDSAGAGSLDAALDAVRAGAGTQFDPDLVKVFLDLPRAKLEAVRAGDTEDTLEVDNAAAAAFMAAQG